MRGVALKAKLARVLLISGLGGCAALILVPVLWIASAAFRRQVDILLGKMVVAPVLVNFEDLLSSTASNFVLNFGNSLIVATASTALVVLITSMAAYALYRMRWPRWLTPALMLWMLVFHMIPPIVIGSAWFVVFQTLGLLDTYSGLILGHVTLHLPIGLWIMSAFIRDVPREIEESAMVDGCGPGGVFFRIVLPVVVPGLIATAMLVFIFSWDEFPIALTLTSMATQTVPVAISKFSYQMEVRHGTMAAGAVLSTIPALVFLVIGQRYIVRGLVSGALK